MSGRRTFSASAVLVWTAVVVVIGLCVRACERGTWAHASMVRLAYLDRVPSASRARVVELYGYVRRAVAAEGGA